MRNNAHSHIYTCEYNTAIEAIAHTHTYKCVSNILFGKISALLIQNKIKLKTNKNERGFMSMCM